MTRPLEGHHTLARSVTSGQDAKICRRAVVIPILVFDDSSDVISTDWTDIASEGELVELGKERAQKRGVNRKFHGWAMLSVQDAKGSGRTVCHTPMEMTPDSLPNPFHVDIKLRLMNGAPGDIRTQHLQELADAARWESWPPSTQAA